MDLYKEKTALITGASTGIGAAFAKALCWRCSRFPLNEFSTQEDGHKRGFGIGCAGLQGAQGDGADGLCANADCGEGGRDVLAQVDAVEADD